MVRKEIKKLIQKSYEFYIKKPPFEELMVYIEKPPREDFGDYVASFYVETGKVETVGRFGTRFPSEVYKKIVIDINKDPDFKKAFNRVEFREPVFINFFLSKEYLQKQVDEVLKQGEKFGELKIGKGQKVQVEFISANPTGLLHIGNGRGAFFGDCLANVLEKAGYRVEREYYINDAKTNTQIRTLGQTALGKGITYLNEYLKSKIEILKSKLNKIEDEGEAGHLLAQEVQKDIEDFVEKKLKIEFDKWFPDSRLYREGKIEKIFSWLKKKNYIYQKEGAWWIKTSDFGDEKDWVIIRSKEEGGEPTYFLCDIAYHKDKIDRGFKKIIDVWGADHQAHVSKMKAAINILGFKGDLDILITQLVTLKGRPKISKRKGEIVTLEELIGDIGLDSARFFYLTKSLDTHMEIDLDLAKEQSEKNPVFYIQYAHARICSILRKLKTKNGKLKTTTKNLKLLNHPNELELVKQLIRFPEIIEDTAKDYQVQRISQYAIDLATSFHRFYRDCRVISEDKNLTKARLSLILATKQVIKNTLNSMGISAPERM